MIRKVQLELQRTGCFAGQPSGVWGARSDAALRLYRQHAKAAADLTGPSAATLETLRAAKGRVCPLQCGIDEKAERGRCVKLMRGNAPAEQPVDWVAPPAMKPARAAKPVVTGGCDSIRSACAQLRAQCMRSCRVALADKTSGNCSGCITSYSQCISRGSSGACP